MIGAIAGVRSRRGASWGWCLNGPLFLLLLLAPVPASAQQEQLQIVRQAFESDLEDISRDFPGVIGIYAIDLRTGMRFGIHEELIFPQGSAIKIPVLIELYRQAAAGELDLAEGVTIQAEQQVGGSGVLEHFSSGGSSVSLHDLAVLMIVLSDNSATNILIERVGMANVNRTMGRLGLEYIRLQRKMMDIRARARGDENLATPAAAASIMARIYRCELPMPRTACESLRDILEIPKSGAFTAPLPRNIPIAWKPGGIPSVTTAWGLVALPGRPYAVAIMMNYGGRADLADYLRRASGTVFAYFHRLARTSKYGTKVPLELVQQ